MYSVHVFSPSASAVVAAASTDIVVLNKLSRSYAQGEREFRGSWDCLVLCSGYATHDPDRANPLVTV